MSCQPPVKRRHRDAGLFAVIEGKDIVADDLPGLVTLAADQQRIARPQHVDTAQDGFGAVAYLAGQFGTAGIGNARHHRGTDRGRLFAAWVVIGDDHDGVHSNGYSLVRKLVEISGLDWQDDCPWATGTLGEALLTPTRIYVKPALAAIRGGGVRALAHITGGGLTENLPRVLPEGLGAEIDLTAWTLPPVFAWLRDAGGLEEAELLRVFNCGIGLCVVVSAGAAERIAAELTEAGETVYRLGEIVPVDESADAGAEPVTYRGHLA